MRGRRTWTRTWAGGRAVSGRRRPRSRPGSRSGSWACSSSLREGGGRVGGIKGVRGEGGGRGSSRAEAIAFARESTSDRRAGARTLGPASRALRGSVRAEVQGDGDRNVVVVRQASGRRQDRTTGDETGPAAVMGGRHRVGGGGILGGEIPELDRARLPGGRSEGPLVPRRNRGRDGALLGADAARPSAAKREVEPRGACVWRAQIERRPISALSTGNLRFPAQANVVSICARASKQPTGKLRDAPTTSGAVITSIPGALVSGRSCRRLRPPRTRPWRTARS